VPQVDQSLADRKRISYEKNMQNPLRFKPKEARRIHFLPNQQNPDAALPGGQGSLSTPWGWLSSPPHHSSWPRPLPPHTKGMVSGTTMCQYCSNSRYCSKHFQLFLKAKVQGHGGHAYNPSYSGGIDLDDLVQGQKVSEAPSPRTPGHGDVYL
jgi:hypothetical protein